MKIIAKILRWILALFFILLGLVYLKSASGIAFIGAAILTMPLEFLQKHFSKFIKGKWKAVIVAVLVIGGFGLIGGNDADIEAANDNADPEYSEAGLADVTSEPTDVVDGVEFAATEEAPVVADEITSEPTAKLTAEATAAPTEKATAKATVAPTVKATAKATVAPTVKATAKATVAPTVKATAKVTAAPTVKATEKVTAAPTVKVTEKVTAAPTVKATEKVTAEPTVKATEKVTAEPTVKATEKVTAAPTAAPTVKATEKPAETTYVLNTNTNKFHYKSCSSVKDIAEHNYAEYTGTRDEVINKGYTPCGRCHP